MDELYRWTETTRRICILLAGTAAADNRLRTSTQGRRRTSSRYRGSIGRRE